MLASFVELIEFCNAQKECSSPVMEVHVSLGKAYKEKGFGIFCHLSNSAEVFEVLRFLVMKSVDSLSVSIIKVKEVLLL